MTRNPAYTLAGPGRSLARHVMLQLHAHLAHRSHVIWDWNGTLIDDVELCARAVAAMLEQHGLPAITIEEHRRLFRMPVREFYRDLGFDLDRVTFEALAHDFIERYAEGVRSCRLFEGTIELLDRLQAAGARQAVLSAAREADLAWLLEHFGIRPYFEHVCGLPDVYATTKIERGRELIRLWGADPARVVLVGDMDHDVEVARALGIDVLVVGDGHQAEERLAGLQPIPRAKQLPTPNCQLPTRTPNSQLELPTPNCQPRT